MEFLLNLANNTQFPLITAFILGLMTGIIPCPMATNISAIGFIGKDIQNRNKIFLNGLLYALGHILSYSILGAILIYLLKQGISIFKIQKIIASIGEIFIGPLLIIVGIIMLDIIKIHFLSSGWQTAKLEQKTRSKLGPLFLGLVLAITFCPNSAALYFGALIPLSVSTPGGYLLPVIFAVAAALPVIVIAWILAFSISGIGVFYNKIRTFEKWFRRVAAIVFILVGLYFCWRLI